jgi:hypothetical protein
MVNNIVDELEHLNTPQLNKMIVSVDWIINGVRDFYKKYENTGVRLQTRNFSASILTSRGMLFLDRAHSTKDVDEIINYVYENTTTGEEKNILKNIQNSTIPKLVDLGLIELGENDRIIDRVMPYPVSSKYFVYKSVIGELYRQQINQFEILAVVQDFPVQKSELESNSSVPTYFNRDYQAIHEIDIIRPKMYNNIEYAVAKDYIMTNKESLDIWQSILETGSPVRQSFRDLMVLQGQLGGYITEQDIIENLGWSQRAIYRMLRRADSHGLAKLTRTLNWEDALIRPIRGTKIAFNYTQLCGAQEVLTLTRRVPDSIDILDKLHSDGTISIDDILDEFNPGTVAKTEHILTEVGILDKDKLRDGSWSLAKNKECEDFLFELKTIAVNSRRVLESKSTQKKLEDYVKYLDDKTIDTDSKRLQEEYDKEFGKIIRK